MELWTETHMKSIVPALAVMFLLSLLLRKLLIGKDMKIRMIPIQVITAMLLLLEVGKQTVSFLQGYDLYHIPLHVCSLFLFIMPAMAFYRGKHSHSVRAIAAAFCTAVFALMMIYPNLLYSADNVRNFFRNYLDFHTVAFHNLVMLLFMLLLALNLHDTEKGHGKAVLIFTACYCVVAASMAHLLKTNFANFYSCNIPPLEDLRLKVTGVLGVVPTQLLYVLIVAALNVGFVLGVYQLYRLLNRLNAKKKVAQPAHS